MKTCSDIWISEQWLSQETTRQYVSKRKKKGSMKNHKEKKTWDWCPEVLRSLIGSMKSELSGGCEDTSGCHLKEW